MTADQKKIEKVGKIENGPDNFSNHKENKILKFFRKKWQRLENFSPEIPKIGQNQKRTRY